MKKYLIESLIIVLLLMSAIGASGKDLAFSGYVRNTTGVLIDGSFDYSQIQNTFNFKTEYYGDISELKAEVFLDQTDTNEIDASIRELYMDIFFDTMDIRIGKQQIIWGKADGVFITDLVSPKDLSNFVLPDFDEIRMGVTALKLDYYMDNVNFELVLIPMFTPSIMPENGTIWEVSNPLLKEPEPVTFNTPETSLDNSEAFIKMSYIGSMIDLELMGAYMWNDLPSFSVDSEELLNADYSRIAMTGGSFSTDILGLIIKGEGAYYTGKDFTMITSSPSNGITTVEKDFINYMLGLDYSIAGFSLSTQFVQEMVLDYNANMIDDEANNIMTFLVAKSFLNDTIMLEFFSYLGLTDNDLLLRPKIIYDFADGLEWVVGADIFIGDSGSFGQYDDNDLVYTKIKYSF